MAETSAAEMHDFLLYWACRFTAGRIRVRAPDAATARRDLTMNPSRYGLPTDRITVLKVLRCVVIEPDAHPVPD